jgi:hypothetical protein
MLTNPLMAVGLFSRCGDKELEFEFECLFRCMLVAEMASQLSSVLLTECELALASYPGLDNCGLHSGLYNVDVMCTKEARCSFVVASSVTNDTK